MRTGVDIENINISKHEYFTKEEFEDWYNSVVGAIDNAKARGYTNVKVNFESTLEAYEDNYPGDPKLTIYGDRPYTEKELKEQKKQDEINALAKKLGITFYEANTILNLQSRGKLKDL